MNGFSRRPDPSEYAAFYRRYVDLVPDGGILATLERQGADSVRMLQGLDPEKGYHRYAPGKWTLNEVLVHMMDTERIFAYRALRFSRGDKTPIPGFDQDQYIERIANVRFHLPDLVDQFARLRASNLDLFRSFTKEMLEERGEASGKEITVRALLWITAGHERHHMKIIRVQYLTS